MEPTLKVGDYFIADYKYYKSNPVESNDVIVIKYPKNPNQKFIERCIAIGGQELEIKDHVVFIDGKLFSGFQKSPPDANADSGSWDNRTNFGPVTVPDDHCFVLGDNRENSYDSRYWGFVPFENVVAKPLYVYWSKDYSRIGNVIN
jgi:signal peptidase I